MANARDDGSVVAEYTRLISLAVHEMRTPASVVGGYIRLLLNDKVAPLDERQRHMLEEAEKACRRLVAHMSELSDLGRLDAGTASVNAESFDLFEMARDVASQVREAEDRDIRLTCQGPTTGAPVHGDRTRLRASVECVLRAVMREQPASTLVVLEARRLDGAQPTGLIVVAPEMDVARASASSPSHLDETRGGLGLGLPIARRVISHFGGRIWSPTPTDGTELPLGSRGAIAISIPLRA